MKENENYFQDNENKSELITHKVEDVIIGEDGRKQYITTNDDKSNIVSYSQIEGKYVGRIKNLGNVIDLTPLQPMSDFEGEKTKTYQVKIENTVNKKQTFQIKLMRDVAMVHEDGCNKKQLPYQYLHYKIGDGEVQMVDFSKRSPILYTDSLAAHEKRTIKVRIWVVDTLPKEYLNYHYHGKLSVKSVETVE